MSLYSPGADAYCKYYKGQHGGSAEFPVFVGDQHGEGLGSVFRSVLRFFIPIALRGITSFATNTLQKHNDGAELSEAARSSIMPALGAMASGVANAQSGKGLFAGENGVKALFSGENGISHDRQHQYISEANKTKRSRAKKRKAIGNAHFNF
jgi:hypothetical protein